MKTSIVSKSLAVLALALAVSGCSQTRRYITAQKWEGGDKMYVGYTQLQERNFILFKTSTYDSRVLRCNRQSNNALQCQEEKDVSRYLNVENSDAASDVK